MGRAPSANAARAPCEANVSVSEVRGRPDRFLLCAVRRAVARGARRGVNRQQSQDLEDDWRVRVSCPTRELVRTQKRRDRCTRAARIDARAGESRICNVQSESRFSSLFSLGIPTHCTAIVPNGIPNIRIRSVSRPITWRAAAGARRASPAFIYARAASPTPSRRRRPGARGGTARRSRRAAGRRFTAPRVRCASNSNIFILSRGAVHMGCTLRRANLPLYMYTWPLETYTQHGRHTDSIYIL